MVSIDSSEGGETIAHNSKEGYKDAINDMDSIDLFFADIDPADEEKDPGETEESNQSSIKRHKEAKRSPDVLPETLKPSLEPRTSRVEHVSDMVIQLRLVLGTPAFKGCSVGQGGIVGVGEARSDGVGPGHGRRIELGVRRLRGRVDARGKVHTPCFTQATGWISGSSWSLGIHLVLVSRQDVGGASVDPGSEVGDEEGILDVGECGQGLNLGVYALLVSQVKR